jgi:hypothetical protein
MITKGGTKPMSESESLKRLFLEDRKQRAEQATVRIDGCFLCDRSYSPQPPTGDDSTRFCSAMCREAYDAGAMPARDIDPFAVPADQWRVVAGPPPGFMPRVAMRQGRHGCFIDCLQCKREFESKGLRCCSIECERAYRQRRESVAALAEIGEALPEKRKCECCGGPIPNWIGTGVKRKRTPKSRRYCSGRCQRQANKTGGFFAVHPSKTGSGLSDTSDPVLGASEAEKPQSIFGPSTPPLNLVGGYRWPGAPDIDLVLDRKAAFDEAAE